MYAAEAQSILDQPIGRLTVKAAGDNKAEALTAQRFYLATLLAGAGISRQLVFRNLHKLCSVKRAALSVRRLWRVMAQKKLRHGW
jgi:hypothetical protein